MHYNQNSADKMSRYKVLVHKQLMGPRASPIDTTVPTKPAASCVVGLPLDTRRTWMLPFFRLRVNPSKSPTWVGSQQHSLDVQ